MKDTNEERMPNVNREKFVLVTNPNASFEDYGWTEDFVKEMLYIAANEPGHEWMDDAEILNNLGVMFNDAIGVKRDMELAIKYYKMAVDRDYDLARSNLADIYRKGSFGAPKDLVQAFELYKDCHIPYAYYRVGEAYENGWGVEKDLQQAKIYYRISYEEGHPLAKKKLCTFDFLN